MARFDSGVRFDSGARFDSGPAASPPRTKNMSQIKTDLDGKDADETLAFSNSHINAMAATEAAAIYPTPEPSVADFQVSHNRLRDAIALVNSLQTQLDAAKLALEGELASHKGSLRLRADYVQLKSGGDPEKIVLTAFSVRSEAAPVGDLPAPLNLSAKPDAHPGAVKLRCKPVRGARSYLWRYREHGTTGEWTVALPSTGARTTITGLTTGRIYAFQAAAVGSAGPSPWSDEALHLAP